MSSSDDFDLLSALDAEFANSKPEAPSIEPDGQVDEKQLDGLPKAYPRVDEFVKALQDGELDTVFELPKVRYCSQIFCLSHSGVDDSVEYHDLMNKLYDVEVEHMVLPAGREPSKSWMKDGSLMIFVEWLEGPEKDKDTADQMDY